MANTTDKPSKADGINTAIAGFKKGIFEQYTMASKRTAPESKKFAKQYKGAK